jgi:hypothetical protein
MVTGEIILSKDSRTLTIVVKAFDGKSDEVRELHRFSLPTDRTLLADCGQSFVISRKSESTEKDAADSNAKSRALTDHAENPVRLKILYDGNIQIPERTEYLDPCQYKVSPIKENTKLTFEMENTSEDTVAVLLAVNGKNTSCPESIANRKPRACTKWVLYSKETLTVTGFYNDKGDEIYKFKVVDDPKPRPGVDLVMRDRGLFDDPAALGLYSENTGTFAVYVFRQRSDGPSGTKMSLPEDPELRKEADRALVVEGMRQKGPGTKRVPFKCQDEPAVSLVIRYDMPLPR